MALSGPGATGCQRQVARSIFARVWSSKYGDSKYGDSKYGDGLCIHPPVTGNWFKVRQAVRVKSPIGTHVVRVYCPAFNLMRSPRMHLPVRPGRARLQLGRIRGQLMYSPVVKRGLIRVRQADSGESHIDFRVAIVYVTSLDFMRSP